MTEQGAGQRDGPTQVPPCVANPDDGAFLGELLTDLRQRYAALKSVFPPRAVHGDAHLSNLLRDATGTVVVLDLEAFAFGPREWDLAVTPCSEMGSRG